MRQNDGERRYAVLTLLQHDGRVERGTRDANVGNVLCVDAIQTPI